MYTTKRSPEKRNADTICMSKRDVGKNHTYRKNSEMGHGRNKDLEEEEEREVEDLEVEEEREELVATQPAKHAFGVEYVPPVCV